MSVIIHSLSDDGWRELGTTQFKAVSDKGIMGQWLHKNVS